MPDEIKKKRGRPPLSPEMKAERMAQRIVRSNEYHKRTGYAAQKKYKKAHPEKYRSCNRGTYEPKIRIPLNKKEDLTSLLEKEGTSLTKMFVQLVLERYGIDLSSN